VLNGTVHALASTTEKRDPYTAGHQHRVAQLACAIASEMNLPENEIEGIRVAGIVHDIGKIYVAAEILNKPVKLKDIEMELIKAHCQAGYEILKTIEFPWPVADMVLQHHEKLNGTGYPQGLSGNQIILGARILAVADVVEAMISHRPYRSALTINDAIKEIKDNRGVLYDVDVVDACIKVLSRGFEFK
jgi:putative nucleotidyltransferase with HDIG domain